jgi:hypothetical protein
MIRLQKISLWLGSLVMAVLANLIAPINIALGGERGFSVAKANDAALNAALGGDWKSTISLHCAQAKVSGKWWGKLACHLFNLVKPGHCEDMIQTGDE